MLTFLQLSDIHFAGRVPGSPHELDLRLRNELTRDAVAYSREIGGVSAIFVCGDVAYSGNSMQYGQASEWLRELCLRLGLSSELVWVVPGNHDVQQDLTDGPQERRIRAHLREVARPDIDTELERTLTDSSDGPALFAALANYNAFAAQFVCNISPDRPFWVSKLPVEPCCTVCVHGLSSALISDRYDNNSIGRVVVGGMQMGILRKDGEVHMTLCHHPYEWLRDGDEARLVLDGSVALQVTGHVHIHNLRDTDAGWHLAAGALQPPHDETPYEPRYNFITLEVRPGKVAQLLVRIHPRVWNGLSFVADAAYPSGYEERSIPLPDVDCPAASTDPVGGAAALDDPLRRLIHRTAQLQPADQFAAMRLARLDDSALAAISGDRVARAAVEMAERSKKLSELWDAVDTYHGSQPDSSNPFEGN